MPSCRKRRLPLNVWRKLGVLETFFAPTAKRRTPRDRTAAMALLLEYSGGGTPKAVPTEVGPLLHLHVPGELGPEGAVRSAPKNLGESVRNLTDS